MLPKSTRYIVFGVYRPTGAAVSLPAALLSVLYCKRLVAQAPVHRWSSAHQMQSNRHTMDSLLWYMRSVQLAVTLSDQCQPYIRRLVQALADQ
jgi:hypothetical protein